MPTAPPPHEPGPDGLSGQNELPVLAADLGGSNLRAAVFRRGRVEARVRVETAALDGDAGRWLARWWRDLPVAPVAAAVAVAAPVDGDRARLTNARVAIDTADLGLPAVLLNDLAAAALGVDRVPDDQVVHLGGPGPEPGGAMAVLGVGTGLGEAVRIGEHVIPGEGGHAAFAPLDAEQEELLTALRARHGRVEWEHVVGGQALPDLLDHAIERVGAGPALTQALARPGLDRDARGHLVTTLAGEDRACALALRLLLTALGCEAGNMALRHLPRGGLWLTGGVAARLRPWLGPGGDFDEAFRERGDFTDKVEAIPRRLVLDDDVGLRGAEVAVRAMLR